MNTFLRLPFGNADRSSANVDLDWAGLSRTSEQPTGDYFEHMALPAGEIVFAIGESGDDLQPVSTVACIRGCIRAALRSGIVHPAQVAHDLNRILYELYPSEAVVTLFYGQYDPTCRMFRYVNAGHEHPLLIQRTGRVLRLDSSGAPLGLREKSRYSAGALRLQAGDRLVAFTLGVLEALAENEDRGADAALLEIVHRYEDRGSLEIAEAILERCVRSSKAADRTVLVASPVELATGVMHAMDVQELCAFA